ncbi:hypothetical protein HanRHA438_Chr11g0488831 [Helianthus annuus]|nr:hypothetical protein HanRHA438_Chr11g0488831 [Helianthus annuus]
MITKRLKTSNTSDVCFHGKNHINLEKWSTHNNKIRMTIKGGNRCGSPNSTK